MIAERVKELLRNRSNIMAVILCIAGVMLNLSLNFQVTVFKLPLYLDTVGTVAIAGMIFKLIILKICRYNYLWDK
ncbi:hypothetical protein UYO_0329 [Lachnospiraceae bacterium JC7]|nr:hypothetical protein UYO_0329 [Lachnospiraceae bacterium JC7]